MKLTKLSSMNESVQIKDTGVYGKSIFARKNFKHNEVVFEISGNKTTVPTIYTIPIDYGVYIDDQQWGQYLCHSCEPNCGIHNKTQIVAMQEIDVGDEITIDYAMIVPEYEIDSTIGQSSEQDLVCKCGKATCRGRLGSYSKLSKDLRERYKGYVSAYLLK